MKYFTKIKELFTQKRNQKLKKEFISFLKGNKCEKEFVNNLNRNHKAGIDIDTWFDSPPFHSMLISGAFLWGGTEEGGEYWNALDCKWRSILGKRK